jgi:hypothetical protein
MPPPRPHARRAGTHRTRRWRRQFPGSSRQRLRRDRRARPPEVDRRALAARRDESGSAWAARSWTSGYIILGACPRRSRPWPGAGGRRSSASAADRSRNPGILRHGPDRAITRTSHRDHIPAELSRTRLRHDGRSFPARTTVLTGQESTESGAVPTDTFRWGRAAPAKSVDGPGRATRRGLAAFVACDRPSGRPVARVQGRCCAAQPARVAHAEPAAEQPAPAAVVPASPRVGSMRPRSTSSDSTAARCRASFQA